MKFQTLLFSSDFFRTFHWIRKWTAWDIGNGKILRIGVDPFFHDQGNYILAMEIIEHLNILEMSTLNQIKRSRWPVLRGGYWLNSNVIDLIGQWTVCRDNYINSLNNASTKLANVNKNTESQSNNN